jgi:hypothetical protein
MRREWPGALVYYEGMAETGSAVQQKQAKDSRITYVETRRGRYMAQTLAEFEEKIEPLLSTEVAQAFKVIIRRKFGALAADVIALIELGDQAKNGYAQDVMDRLFADGPPPRRD